MYENKKEIEEYFIANWTATPIQFDGVEFDNPDRWIGLSFVPIERVSNTCGRKFEISQLKVLCYDTNPTKAIQLMDEVNSFADCLSLTTCYIGTGNADGLGVIDLRNNTYEIASLFQVDKLI